jgi:hypothetical protein
MKRKSKEWHDRAEQYRQYAAKAKPDDLRRTYLEVAQTCELIGARLGHIEEREAGGAGARRC